MHNILPVRFPSVSIMSICYTWTGRQNWFVCTVHAGPADGGVLVPYRGEPPDDAALHVCALVAHSCFQVSTPTES
jgi:hypothetical protein